MKDNSVLGQYKSSCYELIPNYRVSWSHGEQVCVQRGGHLAYIIDADEQGFVHYFLSRYSSRHAVWIGLHDTKIENHFEWTSGSSVSYTNWVPDHLNNFGAHGYEDCVAFVPYKDGKWDDIHCGESIKLIDHDLGEVHPVICQYDLPIVQQALG
ncbi:lectin-like [Ruditapes philippinarum]|uniref:lectin-like n=1 Tax=Ruditapes philippinarum TaxID=129788 RepID=UPI00295BAFBE|nr:lectin-like [Ruditapes philippinarum]